MHHPRFFAAFLLPLALLPNTDLAAPASHPAPASQPTGRISGTVLNAQGKPAAGYRIAVYASPPLPKPLDTLSDSDGRFTLASIPPGSYQLTCVPDGARSPIATIDTLIIKADAPIQNLTITFAAQFSVSGKVELAEGGPAAGWIVRATFVSPDGTLQLDTDTHTDAQGRYTLAGPYKNVSFVDVISSPQPTPAKNLTAPKTDVNFKLLSEEEERKRVR